MLKSKAALLISAIVSLTGCVGVGSLHPLALPDGKETIFDPALLGTWEEADADDVAATKYTVARADSGYSFSLSTGTGEMHGTMDLIQAGDAYLLDVYCPSDGAPLPIHLFVRLRLEKDTAWVAPMDSDWLQNRIKTSGELRRELLAEGDQRVVLTASSTELRQYLLPYAADERAFGDESELHRVAPAGE